MVPSHLAALAALALAAPEERSGSPYFFVHSDQPDVDRLPLESTRADVRVAGVIAHVRVSQVYRNEGSRPIEAVYVFPGSTRAAVFGMRMRIGERTIEAKIDKKEEARRLYEDAKSQGKSASLLEQNRPNVFQMNVANILPGDRIEVLLDYTELMVPEDGIYELIYPTVVGPRYTGESRQEGWTANPHQREGQAPLYRWDLTAEIDSGLTVSAVQSPSHTISASFLGKDRVRVEVDDEKGGNRDFILRWRLGGDAIETGLAFFEGAGQDAESFFLMMVEPPGRIEPSMIPPREYVFIIDVSGSMNGFPIETSKSLMRELLAGLRAQDRFNVMLFAGGSTVLAERSIPASAANVKRAIEVIERQTGGGGTEIAGAIRRALALPREQGMSSTMVVLTDGYVSAEPAVFDLIREGLGDANLFAFGIGSSVNRHLIEGMARAGMGEPFVVLDAGEAEDKSTKFRRYIDSPVLTDVRVKFEGLDVHDVEPAKIPDLFARRPVIVFGKYRGQGQPRGRVVLSGSNGQGRFERTLAAEQYAPNPANSALRQLWARQRVARLSDLQQLSASAKTVEEVTATGLRYSLMTAYTSFVAIDSQVRSTGGKPEQVRQPLPMPEGVSNGAVGGALASASIQGWLMKPQGAVRGGVAGGGGEHAIAAPDAPSVAPAPPPLATAPSPAPEPRMSRKNVVQFDDFSVAGSLDRRSISLVIQRHRAAIRSVYDTALKSNPNLSGRVVVKFTIDASGAVTGASVTSSTVADAELVKKLLEVVRRMRFDPTPGGGSVTVNYPFVFRLP